MADGPRTRDAPLPKTPQDLELVSRLLPQSMSDALERSGVLESLDVQTVRETPHGPPGVVLQDLSGRIGKPAPQIFGILGKDASSDFSRFEKDMGAHFRHHLRV
jgi:hypothetical protein